MRQANGKLRSGDAMLLIAAGCVGLAGLRWALGTLPQFVIFQATPPSWGPRLVVVGTIEILAFTLPFVASWTVVIPILRLRRPRPPFWRIARQPGTAACLAALLGLAWGAASLSGSMLLDQIMLGHLNSAARGSWGWPWKFLVEEVFAYIGLAVASAWTCLALTGCWRPVPDWVDRLGRAVGVSWLVIGLAWAFRRYLDLL
jgi:hypothetical protein